MISDADYNTSDWSTNYDRIFGKNGNIKANNVSKKSRKKARREAKRLQMVEKSICPHCATKNYVKTNAWQGECKKCGWDK